MARSQHYQYFDLAKPTLPYISYTSPVNETPHFIPGSQNIMASQIGYIEKRPGFSTPIETTPSVIPGIVKRIFPWRRWGGSFFVMVCTIDTVAKVYKLEQGVDASFSLIWTSSSAVPFDFVVSDNFCFFGNGTDMRKFDGTQVTKWGTDAPPAAPPVALQSGTLPPGMVFADPTLSGTPTTQGTSQITFKVTDAVGNTTSKTYDFVVNPKVVTITTDSNLANGQVGSAYVNTIVAQYGTAPYTYSVFSGALPAGIVLNPATGGLSGSPTTAGFYSFSIQATDATAAISVKGFTLPVITAATFTLSPASPLASAAAGVPYANTITASGGTAPYTFTYIPDSTGVLQPPYNTLPQGITFTTASPNINLGGTATVPGSYGFRVLATDSTGLTAIKPYILSVTTGTLTFLTPFLPDAFQSVAYSKTITVTGGTGPYTITYTAGELDAQTGYVYGYSYTTIYGHESNVSPLSDSTGIFTGENPTLLLTASPDVQVNGINLYRTTDGGIADPSIMRLVISLPNTNQTYQDSTQDQFLGSQTGPGFLINTPPTPTLGFVWSNGRIYGFIDNKVFYSGFEEVSNGIPEEAWPSGLDGNYYPWPSQVGGMAVTDTGVDIGISEQFWQVSGDSLDTFRKSLLLDKAGVGSPTCIHSVGNSVQWFDSAKQIWSSSLGEIGLAIRSDLTNCQPDSSYLGYHKSGTYNWEYFLDALNGKLYVFDLDLDQWYAPWTVNATAIASGETASGVISLLAAIGGKILSLTPGTYVDNGATYEDDIKTNLLPISPGRNTTARSKMEPAQVEEIMFEMQATDYEGVFPALVAQLCDNDPITADFTDWSNVTFNNVTPQFIPRAKKICQYRFITDTVVVPAIRAAFWYQWAPSATGWRVYSLTISWMSA